MHEEKISKVLFWAAGFILFLPIIILPPTFQPSEWSRTILFRLAIVFMASFIFFKYFYKKESALTLPKWNTLAYLPVIVLSLFILTVIISTLFSQDPLFSFFGTPKRAAGSLNILFYFAFSIILALFISQNYWEKLWKIMFFAAILISGLAIIQSFNLLKTIFLSYEGGGVPSFLGNSTFMAIYMLFMAMWAFVLFLQKKDKKQKIWHGFLFLLFSATIFLSGSRATYLALLISLFFFFFLFPIKIKKIKTLKITAASLLAFAILIVLIFNFFPQLNQKNYIFQRLADRLSIEKVAEDLFGTRLAVWQIASKAIKDKPLLGWGPENFYIGFEKYYEPTASNLQKLWWDKPHNIFLDIAANMGVISLVFYMAFWSVLLWSLQGFKQKETDTKKIYFAHALQSIFIGYLTILFFNFDSFASYLISYFFIGYAFFLFFEKKEKADIKNLQNFLTVKNRKIFAGIFSLAALAFIFFWNINPLLANENLNYAKMLANSKNCKKSLQIIEDVNKNPKTLGGYGALIYFDTARKCTNPEKEVAYAKKGFETLQKASEIQPKNSRLWLFMGSFTNVLAAREENQDSKNELLKEAMGYLRKSLELSPKRQDIFTELEKSYLIAADYQSVKKTAYGCIDIDANQGVCYWYLGVAEIFMGDQANGKKHIQEALKKGGFSPSYIQLGSAYLSQKNYKDAADVYHLLTASYPDNAGYHAVMAFLAKEIGDYERAGSEALYVFKLQPDNKDAVDFLIALLGLNPSDPKIHTYMAVVYKELGQKEKAAEEFSIAKRIYIQKISANPNIPDYHVQLAKIYAALGEYEKSYKEALLLMRMEWSSANQKEWAKEFVWNELPTEFWDDYLKNYENKEN